MNGSVVATISHNKYKDVLLNNKSLKHSMNRIQSKDHKIETYKINKISLCCFDDKKNIQNSFFVKYVVLIFSLIRKAFLSIYKDIARLLAWHVKFEKQKALKKGLNEELMPIT